MNDLGTGKEREVAALVSTPGLRLLVTLAESVNRGMHRASNDEVFVVNGSKLYRISSAWVATELGTLSTSTGPVSMADNGTHLAIVDGTNGYTWTIATDTFATISDPDFLAADQVTFQDGYFIFNKIASQQFFISDLNGVAFDALDIATAEGSPDNLVGIHSLNQNLYLFGKQSTEVFYNSGNADFPFERIQGAINGVGCSAAFSIQEVANSIIFVGGDKTGTGIVYRMQGYQAQRISTSAIESIIRGLSADDLADATAWTYQQGGHAFYCLNLPSHDATWCYDATTGLWHERTYLSSWGLQRHRAQCHALAHGENIVGDYESGAIYALDPDTYTDNTQEIVRLRAGPHFSQGLVKITHYSFQLDMETGVGLNTGQGSDPVAVLQWSDDGGHTWSNEKYASVGAIGTYGTRVIWRRLGASRDRVYRVIISEPIKVVMIGAEINVEAGVA
jgi:hypothetical protein